MTTSTASMYATHPFYAAWYNMHQRCYNEQHVSFRHYGGRGIFISAEWENFEFFKRDLLPQWAQGLELDRKDNEAGYNKDNCRWATRTQQMRNTRVVKLSPQQVVEIRQLRGKLSQKALGERYGVNASHICRIQCGEKWHD